MNAVEDARASLDEIANRRDQAIDGAIRGRHRGWDATGLLAGWAGFAAMDLPLPEPQRLALFAVGAVAALVCFTRAGLRSRAVVHRSQVAGRFWVILGGLAIASGAFVIAAMQVLEWLDLPVQNTILGGVLVLIVAGPAGWVNRTMLRRPPA